MFAIVDIAGFQEKVTLGQSLRVPTIAGDKGAEVSFPKVLLLAEGGSVTLGKPFVEGASVEATVVEHGKAEKVRVYAMRRRKRYRRLHGHRQGYTDIKITKIVTK